MQKAKESGADGSPLERYRIRLYQLFCLSGVSIVLFRTDGSTAADYHSPKAVIQETERQNIRKKACAAWKELSPGQKAAGYLSVLRQEGHCYFSLTVTLEGERFLVLFGPFSMRETDWQPPQQEPLRCFLWKEIETFLPLFYQETTIPEPDFLSQLSEQKSDWEASVPYNDEFAILHNAQLEQTMIAAIRNGDVEGLRKVLLNSSFVPPEHYQPSSDALRNMKNISLSLNTLSYHAACEVGCPTVYMRSIAARFAAQIEHCRSAQELMNLRRDLVLFYCEKAQAMKNSHYSLPMQAVMAYIYEHMAEDVRLSQIAESLGVSVESLSRRINREYGDSFSALLNGMRIERACQYLHLSIPVQDVAERVGYKSSSQFCRQFRSVMQMTPTEWRTKNVDVR